MSYYKDLTPCDYFPFKHEGNLISVGWLEKGYEYEKKAISNEVYQKLQHLLKDPFQPVIAAGFHECSLCQFESEKNGIKNLFVPYQGKIYVCPELILHYINAHNYRPPEIFIEAILECPDTRSIEYKKKLLKNGGQFLTKPVQKKINNVFELTL